jgi:hypothetical protein
MNIPAVVHEPPKNSRFSANWGMREAQRHRILLESYLADPSLGHGAGDGRQERIIKLARTSRIALAALTALALAPGLITSRSVQAGTYNGTALTDFDRVTPAGASVYLTVQSTSANQGANLTRIGNILGPKFAKAANGELGGGSSGGSGSSGGTAQYQTLINQFKLIFNGEYGIALLSTDVAKGASLPDLLLELGLQKGVTPTSLVSELKLFGITAKPAASYHGVALQAINLGALSAMAGGLTGGSTTPGKKSKTPPSYIGVIGNDAVVGTTLVAIKQAVDAYTGAGSLSKSANFAKTVGKLPKDRFFTTYVNVSNTAASSVGSITGTNSACKPTSTAPGTFSVGFSMSAQPDGVLLSTSPVYTTGSLAANTAFKATANGAVELFPSATLGFASLGDPGAVIAQVVKTLSQSGSLSTLDCGASDPLKAFTKATGLDLNKDILSWMQGDLSVAVLPVGSAAAYKDKGDPLAYTSVVVALKVKNQALAEAKLPKIVAALNAHSTKAERVKVIVVKGPGGVPMHVAAKSPTGLGYAFYKGYLLLASSLPADLAVVQKGGGVAVPLNAALKHFGSGPFSGAVYLDLTSLRALIEKAATASGTDMKSYKASVQPLLEPFKTFSAVAFANGSGTAEFISIGK